MRRSICYCDPVHAKAGEVNTWTCVFTTSAALPKGARLRFDMQTKGRGIDWEIPSSNLKKTSNVIYAVLENGKILQAKEVEVPDSFAPLYDFILPAPLELGTSVTIVIGSPKRGHNDKSLGTRAQTNAQRRRNFSLAIDTNGKGQFSDPEVFTMDVQGGPLKSIRILTPSFVSRNKRFDVIIRFEDEFGNLTSEASHETLIELSHEHLRENLNWKLFVPETGFLTLPSLYFNEPGTYTIKLRNTKTQEVFHSSPIRCFSDNTKHLFWGLLHGESERIDSTENIESCLRYMRDDKSMNFFACSPFESVEETSNETWKTITQTMAEFDEPDRFTSFVGFQWAGIHGKEGVRQIIYSKDGKQILRKKDPKYTTLQKLYQTMSPKEIISIPCFTMAKGYEYNFDQFDPNFERVVEIYNAWGSSECTVKEGNPVPIVCKSKNKGGTTETGEGSIVKALLQNCRFGFVAGGLDDRGIYSGFYEGDQEQYSPGITAIIAAEHSKSALAEALYNRSCYATTGERIILGLYLAGQPMGKELSTAEKPGLMVNRHLSGYVAGTTTLKCVEILRNGEVIKSFECSNYSLDFTYDDMTPMANNAIPAKDGKPPFLFYYLRVTQQDGHTAWSSPIWVDLLPPLPVVRQPKQSQKLSPEILFDEDEEDEDALEEEELDDDLDELSFDEDEEVEIKPKKKGK